VISVEVLAGLSVINQSYWIVFFSFYAGPLVFPDFREKEPADDRLNAGFSVTLSIFPATLFRVYFFWPFLAFTF